MMTRATRATAQLEPLRASAASLDRDARELRRIEDEIHLRDEPVDDGDAGDGERTSGPADDRAGGAVDHGEPGERCHARPPVGLARDSFGADDRRLRERMAVARVDAEDDVRVEQGDEPVEI